MIKKRRVILDDIYIEGTPTIDLDKLSLREFKKYMVKMLSKPLDIRQCYLTTDPLTEKYLFWWNGQIRFISHKVINNMIKTGKLKYFSDPAFRIKNIIVGKNFKGKIAQPKGKYEDIKKPKRKRFIW